MRKHTKGISDSKVAKRAAGKMGRVAVSLMLAATMAAPLAGCRYSSALTEKIIEAPGVAQIDYSLDPVRTENPAQESGNSINEYENESERKDDPEPETPDYDQDEPTQEEQTTSQQNYSDKDYVDGATNEGGKASEKNGVASDAEDDNGVAGAAAEAGEDADKPAPGGTDEEPSDDSETTPPEDQPEEEPTNNNRGTTVTIDPTPTPTDDPQTVDDTPIDNPSGNNDTENTWNPGTGDNGGGEGDGKGQTYNDGTFEQLPQNVGKIAAAGPYATIVQSLGGKGALAACNQKWLDDLPAQAYDNQSELTDVVGIASWGDGKSMDAATIQAIIDTKPDVVLTSDSYGGINTDAQAQAFNEAGISVVVLPPIGMSDALDSDIQTCVTVIGELLKDAGSDIQYDAKKQAYAWTSQHNRALEQTTSNNGGLTTYYDGTTAKEVILQGLPGSERSVSYISGNRYYVYYIDYWLEPDQLIGLDDDGAVNDSKQKWRCDSKVYPYSTWGTETEDGYSDSYARFDISGGLGLYIPLSVPATSARSAYAVIDYYFQTAGVCDKCAGAQYNWSTAGFSYYPYGGTCVIAGNSWVSFGTGASATRIVPGDIYYPYIVVKNKSIAENVRKSADLPPNKNASIIGAYDFGQRYDIAVVPAGIGGSWVDGTFESFLVAPWAYCMYQKRDAGGSISLSYSDEFVNSFYDTFYRCGASGIVDGDGNWGVQSLNGTGCGGYGYWR